MNKFIKAIKDVNSNAVKELLQTEPKWIKWSEENGKNALHYLCGLTISKDPLKTETSFQILKQLLKAGMDINSIHKIPEAGGFFPATPLWHAYTRGRNEKLFTYLLKSGANPEHCMFAIAWYDDVKAAALFKKHGAKIDDVSIGSTPFLAAFMWKKFNVAEWFLKNDANVNFADTEGNTALFYAVKRKYKIEHIKLLLRFGAGFDKENKDGISPKKLAGLNRQRKILGLFVT
jgi:hypothetical protein